MVEDVVLLMVIGFVVIGGRYLYDRWNSRAPFPDGLYPGERLISGLRAVARIDDAFRVGYGFAYLTDHRVVWTPEVGRRRLFWTTPASGPYSEPVIVELPQLRKVDARFRLGGGRLIVETTDLRLELIADGRGFASWERSVQANARRLLPADQPVLRVHDRYSRQELIASSRGGAIFLAFFLLYLGARVLRSLLDLGGDSLSRTQSAGIVVAVVALTLAAIAWETRRR
jgi:hypothetical protein